MGAALGELRLDIVENLCGGLSTADDGDSMLTLGLLEDASYRFDVGRGVNDARLTSRKRLRDVWSASDCDYNMPSSPKRLSASAGVFTTDREATYGLATSRLLRGDLLHLLAVRDDVAERSSAPPEVVLKLDPLRQESVEICKVHQPSFAMQVVEKGKRAARIAERSHVLDKGDLHLGPFEQHAGMPRKPGLALQESDFEWSFLQAIEMCSLRRLERIVERNRNRQ
jgi:hypothetical protein